MALFTEQQLRLRAQTQLQKGQTKTFGNNTPNERAKEFINEARTIQLSAEKVKTYDIFLSHSTTDSEQVMGLKLVLEDLGYSVYIDWIDDPQLSRSHVTKATANQLKERMKSCKSLFYAFSTNSANSKWMPWELGYFDGIKGKVAVLPIRINSQTNSDEYNGTEYLGLYNYVTFGNNTLNKTRLWVHETASKYIEYEAWLKNV